MSVRRVAGAASAALGIGLLWWMTAGEDAEWALWRRYSAATALVNVIGSGLIVLMAYLLVGRGTRVDRLARAALVMGSVALTLAALEVPTFVGHDYGQTFGTRENDTWLQLASGVNRRDDQLIHVHQPHTRYQGAVVGNLVRLGIPSPARYVVDVSYDKNGFRNDVDLTRTDIVAIGDSFVEAAEIPRADTAAAQLGVRLNAVVANLGQSNYGPQQELAVLERYGLPLSPRLVVWFFFGGNDLGDAETYEWRVQHLDELMAPPSIGARSFSRNALRALARVTTPVRRVAASAAREHAVLYAPPSGPAELMYLDTNEEPWSERQWQLVTGVLRSARDRTRAAEAELLVVYIPRKLRVYQGFLRSTPGSFAETWQPSRLPEALGGWCRDQGIDYLDSTVPLRSAVASGVSVYLPDDVHWNVAGHRVVAEAIADRIRQGGKLTTSVMSR